MAIPLLSLATRQTARCQPQKAAAAYAAPGTMQRQRRCMALSLKGCGKIVRSRRCAPRQGERPLPFGARLAIFPILPATRLMEDYFRGSLRTKLVRPTRFERVTPAFGGRYSIQLSYGRYNIAHKSTARMHGCVARGSESSWMFNTLRLLHSVRLALRPLATISVAMYYV